jgi:hypothetical protein
MSRIAIVVFILVISCCKTLSGGKTISINDLRKFGVGYEYKDTAKNHQEGEVIITRTLTRIINTTTEEEDTAEMYNIAVYKKIDSVLGRFYYGASGRKSFDKASVSWIGDTANIIFINSNTNEKAKMRLPINKYGYGESIEDSVFWGFK